MAVVVVIVVVAVAVVVVDENLRNPIVNGYPTIPVRVRKSGGMIRVRIRKSGRTISVRIRVSGILDMRKSGGGDVIPQPR